MNSELSKELIEIRRHLHQFPELGYQEFMTADFICSQLDRMQITYKRDVAKTGIIAEMGEIEGHTIVLRADMDALPLNEDSGVEFVSKHDGLMHACGHDLHTTMLLGACALLKEQAFEGKIKFIFQPSEEGVYDDPEKKSGGQRIVDDGELEGVRAAMGLHVHPLLEVGKLGYTSGEALACTNFFTINIYGKGGHAGAAPQLGIDAILVASNLILTLNTITSRNIIPGQPGVVSVTKIKGGTAPNAIPDHVTIEGTVRALDITTYETIVTRIKEINEGVAKVYGATIEMSIDLYYPSLLNDTKIHEKILPAIEQVFQTENLIPIKPIMGGEDFAFYSRRVPSTFYFIGAQTKGSPYFVHDPKVVFNENCIPIGAEFLAKSALELLK